MQTVSANLSTLSNVLDNNVVKNVVFAKLTKNNVIDNSTIAPSTIGLVFKIQYYLNKQNLQKRLRMLIKKYLILVG